jgi:citrate synthase
MDECVPVLKNTGLRGVEVASSRICDVKGQEGKLIYRGYRIEDLAEKTTFEEICFLLLYERLPQKKELADFSSSLETRRKVPDNLITLLKAMPGNTNPMDILQMAVPMLIQTDREAAASAPSLETTLNSAENLIAGLGTIIAAWDRILAPMSRRMGEITGDTRWYDLSRVSGWTAHVIEEQFATAAPKPSLYRPGAAYVGDYCGPNECTFTDIDQR